MMAPSPTSRRATRRAPWPARSARSPAKENSRASRSSRRETKHSALNVFNFDTAAPDSCFEAEDALAPHLEFARAKGGEGFWSEAAVRERRQVLL